MVSILHFRKELTGPPVTVAAAAIRLRSFKSPADIATWLTLRERALAGESPGVRAWSETDFHREMMNKNWWNPRHSWFAIDQLSNSVAGAVTMALRAGQLDVLPVVHWLLVEPNWRRRGIGRLLVSHLERAAWENGWRAIELETHAGWQSAVAFYHSMGYAPVRERSAG